MKFHLPHFPMGSASSLAAALALIAGLSACGGGQNMSDPSAAASARSGTEGVVFEEAAASPPAELTAQSLEDAEKHAKSTSAAATPLERLSAGQIASWEDYANGNVARKAAAARTPVYRFFNAATGAHFYTTNTTERDHIIAALSPPYAYEGPALYVANAFAPGLSPVYRFYNTQTGVHFYTISESERANVQLHLPQYSYEGIAYYASQVSGTGLTPFYRFYVPNRGFHFYTSSVTERDSIIANLAGTYSYEGIGYYVLDTDWHAEKLPHTGITTAQCYYHSIFPLPGGSDGFGTCDNSLFWSISSNQDAQRTDRNPMSYSAVASAGGNYPLTSCVKDNVTGLIWEGKTNDGGLRDKDNTYTNQGGGAATDASGYVNAIKSAKLCGYNDWRLPTVLELATLLDYGVMDFSKAAVNATWLPNTPMASHWSSETSSATSWLPALNTLQGQVGWFDTTSTLAVRLVRGSMMGPGSRYTPGTVSYDTPGLGADADNNVVNDALTGLQWRRCLYGERWTGSTCSGTAVQYNHRDALTTAGQMSGWRLPNAKEARSLLELTHNAPYINPGAFPSVNNGFFWTSTAQAFNAMNLAYMGSTSNGSVNTDNRTTLRALRLVRVP